MEIGYFFRDIKSIDGMKQIIFLCNFSVSKFIRKIIISRQQITNERLSDALFFSLSLSISFMSIDYKYKY